ncbi:SDR family NAD(P)-dependent oxidoreductase [Novosphingobium flavum]|uniref:SDR family NAD(P)-dependent oxidoreductase n=1 Tax=Novosphingobium aerophilum TaxID=2839843 RepID=UPI00163B3857|nr:SDR family NAD(P)-dependent oxidoreductase [Novosphingobium aerophilum]MBC2660365.1 SDR family NAD(P)-dependent oxidoreductase [Novosphingobium aerophilum]
MTGSLRLDGQVIVVTGAGGGLGRGYVEELARRGARVLANDCHAAALEPVCQAVAAAGGVCLADTHSVAEPEGCAAIVAAALERFGRIDGLVLNAGTIRVAPFAATDSQDLDALLAVHLGGAFHLARAAWPHMAAQGCGRIVFTTSSAGLFGMPQLSAYGAAKGAVAGLMGVLAEEGRDCGIACNAVMPNAASGMTAAIGRSLAGSGGEGPNRWAATAPATFDPRFTAPLVAWLLHPDCPSTHAIYSAALGRITRVFVGVGPGWQGPIDRPPSMEEIAEQWERIGSPDATMAVPENAYDEFRIVAEAAGR